MFACRTQATSQTDNAPLVIYDTIWFWMYGGCLQPADGSHWSLIMAGISSGGAVPAVGPILMRDVHITGGGILYSQRMNSTERAGGRLDVRQSPGRGLEHGFPPHSERSGNPGVMAMRSGPITIDYLLDSDAGNNNNAVIGFNWLQLYALRRFHEPGRSGKRRRPGDPDDGREHSRTPRSFSLPAQRRRLLASGGGWQRKSGGRRDRSAPQTASTTP